MTQNGLELMARRDDWADGVAIYMRKRTADGDSVASSVLMTPHEIGTRVDPMLHLSIHEAQQLVDELWQCGLRPSEGSGSAGAMAATQKHLEDMRTLVFKKQES